MLKLGNEIQVKIKFIGTGSAKANPKRFFTSFILSNSRTNLLVDCGDGISRRFVELKISFDAIDNILITHLHPDHFTGIASLLVQMKLIKRSKDIKIYIHKNLVEFLEYFIERIYLFKEKFPFDFKIISYNFNDVIEIENEFKFTAKPNSHLIKYDNLSIDNLKFLVSSSFLFDINKNKIYYSADVGKSEDLYIFNSDFKVCLIETSHIKIEEIISFVEIISADKFFLVHIDEENDDLLRKVFSDRILNEKVFIPNDGDEYLV